jgi:TfoX/Sxy family transcriptional regulator of competence genes
LIIMAYDERLEQRIDAVVAGWDVVVDKKKMFGGLGYLINGNMAFGIHHGGEVIVRLSETDGKELLKQPDTRNFTMGPRTSMKNWYLVGGEFIADDAKLAELLGKGRDYALTLPPKAGK